MKNGLKLVLAIAASAILLSACGSSEESTAQTDATTTAPIQTEPTTATTEEATTTEVTTEATTTEATTTQATTTEPTTTTEATTTTVVTTEATTTTVATTVATTQETTTTKAPIAEPTISLYMDQSKLFDTDNLNTLSHILFCTHSFNWPPKERLNFSTSNPLPMEKALDYLLWIIRNYDLWELSEEVFEGDDYASQVYRIPIADFNKIASVTLGLEYDFSDYDEKPPMSIHFYDETTNEMVLNYVGGWGSPDINYEYASYNMISNDHYELTFKLLTWTDIDKVVGTEGVDYFVYTTIGDNPYEYAMMVTEKFKLDMKYVNNWWQINSLQSIYKIN